MPTLESTDYERFSIDEATTAMTLDEAVKKAREMRVADSSSFYRVEAIDQNANAFRVDKVPIVAAYVDFVARIARTMFRYSRPHRS
jgi:hypothetical protein